MGFLSLHQNPNKWFHMPPVAAQHVSMFSHVHDCSTKWTAADPIGPSLLKVLQVNSSLLSFFMSTSTLSIRLVSPTTPQSAADTGRFKAKALGFIYWEMKAIFVFHTEVVSKRPLLHRRQLLSALSADVELSTLPGSSAEHWQSKCSHHLPVLRGRHSSEWRRPPRAGKRPCAFAVALRSPRR